MKSMAGDGGEMSDILKTCLFFNLLQYNYYYSGPCNLRPLYLTIPCILRPDISGTTSIFSV